MPKAFPLFDGHNDVLLRLMGRKAGDPVRAFLEGERDGQLDLPRAEAGGFCGGFFAMFVPSADSGAPDEAMQSERYDIPLPEALRLSPALETTLAMAALLIRIERESRGRLAICRSAAEIRRAIGNNTVAAVMHIEGAEAIDPDFTALDVLYEAGLRSIGPVWSRPNAFGHGVPFRFPSGPDTGPGLTDLGLELVRQCNARRIMIDLSHLNEKGFWDVARLSDAPLVATHSNAHAVCPHSRNLTDRQLAAIRETKGMVGINLATFFLRPDGRRDAATAMDDILRHLDHLIETVGEDGVGLGSDFDGATIPAEIGDVSGLPRLIAAMRRAGYDDALITKFATGNWVRVLEATWGA